jgi:hypothetical protein
MVSELRGQATYVNYGLLAHTWSPAASVFSHSRNLEDAAASSTQQAPRTASNMNQTLQLGVHGPFGYLLILLVAASSIFNVISLIQTTAFRRPRSPHCRAPAPRSKS